MCTQLKTNLFIFLGLFYSQVWFYVTSAWVAAHLSPLGAWSRNKGGIAVWTTFIQTVSEALLVHTLMLVVWCEDVLLKFRQFEV